MSTHSLNELNGPIFINYHKKTWKTTVCISWFIYIVFQFGLYISTLENNSICRHNHHDPTKYGQFYWYTNYSCFSVFITLWIIIVIKLGLMDANKKRIPLLLTLNIITLSTLTSILNIFWGNGSICIDTLGVATPTSIWAEWLVCGPQTIYVILTTTYFNEFNYWDYGLIASFFFCILFGFFIVIPQPQELAKFWLFMSCISYVFLHYLPFYKAKIISISEYALINNDIREKIYIQQSNIRQNLSIWMSAILPFYTVNYLFGMFRVFNYAQTVITFQILSVVTKGIFVALCSDIHLKLLSTAEEIVITERKINLARREFMKFIFHEIRNPLNSMSIGLDLLNDIGFENKSDFLDILQTMRVSSMNMTETLNGILNMHKIEEGKLDLIIIDTDIRKIVRNILSELNIYILQKSIQVVLNIDEKVPANIKIDGIRIEQVLNKLINNAIKYSPTNSKIIVCMNVINYAPFDRRLFSFIKKNVIYNDNFVNSSREQVITPYNTLLNVSVADEGPGINDSEKHHIFNNFIQARPVSLTNKNWGLNLAFCKKIVKLHGGNIWVETETNKGCIFHFQIPIYEKHSSLVDSLEVHREHNSIRHADLVTPENKPNLSSNSSHKICLTNYVSSGNTCHNNNITIESVTNVLDVVAPPPKEKNVQRVDIKNTIENSTTTKESIPINIKNQIENNITHPPAIHALVVDDSETNCKMLARLLKMNHISSDIALNGKLATEMVMKQPDKYSFIFMDNLMPVMNGCVATSIIRNMGYRNIIAGITGNILDDDIAEFLHAGANIVYKKPLSILSLKKFKSYIDVHGCVIDPEDKLIESVEGIKIFR